MHNNNSLDQPGRNYHTDKPSSDTYRQVNPHQPTGHFEMPMGLDDINHFENLNEVRIKVFGYDGRDLFPLRVSKSVSNFTMGLLLLYEADCYHYVLITKLVKVVSQLRNTKFIYAGIVSGCVKKALQSLPNVWRPAVKMRRLLFDYQLREKIYLNKIQKLGHYLVCSISHLLRLRILLVSSLLPRRQL